MIQSGKELVLVTRKSPLALVQADLASVCFEKAIPGTSIRIEKIMTTGDKRREWSLEKEGGKGLFTKELEDALLENRADFAVHSAKDLPSDMPDGLAIAGFLPRESAEDMLILSEGVESPKVIATGSPRRRIQLRYLYPEAEFIEIRGNVDTRLNKIAEGYADATMLAAAGLKRLGIDGWEGVTFKRLSLDECIPAVGQAAVAIQCREEDVATYAGALDYSTNVAVRLERAFMERLGGGCQVAFAVNYTDEKLRIYHRQCGKEMRTIPFDYATKKPNEIADQLIRQLELGDA
jgi:hydroxymethylbilane synthase